MNLDKRKVLICSNIILLVVSVWMMCTHY